MIVKILMNEFMKLNIMKINLILIRLIIRLMIKQKKCH